MESQVIKHIRLDDRSATPKYLQLVNSIVDGIRLGHIKKDQVLPSINELSFQFDMSRDTAERGYKHLKEMGVLGSVPGKGFFIRSTEIHKQLRICLLFNKLSAHKKIIYDSITASLSDQASFDLYIYNNDFTFFKKLFQSKTEGYTHYIVIPHFLEGGELAGEIINTVDKSKLVLLDKLLPGITGNFSAVYENFEEDIYSALEQALPKLSQYQKLKLVFPVHSYFPREIIQGFKKFCNQFAFESQLVESMRHETINRGEVFITLMEDDLVTLVEKILATELKVGIDVGVISYNETPLKKIILNGITTVSTDFQLMGEWVAQIILSKKPEKRAVPFYLTLRPSL